MSLHKLYVILTIILTSSLLFSNCSDEYGCMPVTLDGE